MLITDPKEKLVLFINRRHKKMKDVARELDICPQYFSKIIRGKYEISDKVYKEIEHLFQREQFLDGLDDYGRL